ncbi:MAG: DUF1850 domain-containing protein, partial [Candidatus Adiutrix sp.]
MKNIKTNFLKIIAVLAISLSALLGWPIDVLTIGENKPERNTPPILSHGLLLGETFSTSYLHSVELTPVHEHYRLRGGEIWLWQVWQMSHNAGLISQTPARGRFFHAPPWMVLEGHSLKSKKIIYRVGNSQTGQNILYVKRRPPINLYQLHPDQSL